MFSRVTLTGLGRSQKLLNMLLSLEEAHWWTFRERSGSVGVVPDEARFIPGFG
jgi:hypothetical protein